EIELARTALQERAEQLALSSKYKSEFLANMSHELRTPLNSLLILARLLSENQNGNLTDKQIEFAETIHAAGSDLLQLINDILDLSKVEAGKMEVHPGDVSLPDVRDYVERTFGPLAEEKGLGLDIEIAVDTPATIVTDEIRLQQILKNLVSNAIKFTDNGGVVVRIEPADGELQFATPELASAESVMVFSVTDTGIGIPDEKLHAIFEAFQQADGTTSRRYGGTGLGLNISREIATLLGGEIRVRSQLGRGSTFTLYLPATTTVERLAAEDAPMHAETVYASELLSSTDVGEQPERVALVTRSADLDADILRGKRVLVVDDDVRNVFALTSALEAHGMEVAFAENGRAGIDTLEQNPDVDLVLMDIMMPELDGYEAMRAIRDKPEFTNLPIISLTAKAMKGDRERSIESGASDYITKPVDTDQLLSLMRVWLGG
ncbi:MAG: response regulator, partial [Actinobacteria bacterium]|nr:response regulator [Actinomycetota bacterium]